MVHPQLSGLLPTAVLFFFSLILRIPRRSHEEDEMVAFIRDWAKSRGYETKVDDHKNIVVFVPATPGYKGAPTLCLQAHTDMVCVGNTQWPIDIEVKDGWVMTAGQTQTLGADNGLGVAMAMAACDGTHGPLELLFTSDEEDDFSGCDKFRRDNFGMKSRLLVNLDTPHDARITVASAGFVYLLPTFKLQRAQNVGKRYVLRLDNLPGGHSGEDVHTFRGNSLKLMADLVARLPVGSLLITIDGGEKGNSIPKGCTTVVQIPEGEEWEGKLQQLVDNARETLRCPSITFTVKPDTSDLLPLTPACHARLISLLRSVPSGVVTMSLDLVDLPELSSTPSLVKPQGDDVLQFKHQIRGATEQQIDGLFTWLCSFYTSRGCEVAIGHRGRSWVQDTSHRLVKATQMAYEQTGYPGVLSGNHGAIEPGTLCGDPINPAFDAAVSFGCWIRDEHKETERFYLPSLERTFAALQQLLANVAKNGL